MLSGKYYVVSDEKLPPSQRIAATDNKRPTKKKNSNNDDVSLQSTNKEGERMGSGTTIHIRHTWVQAREKALSASCFLKADTAPDALDPCYSQAG